MTSTGWAALRDADIKFDVNSAGDAISVRRGQTVQARVMLAEKGLPNSSNAGYELFDKVGSLGLTSFMQEVTRVAPSRASWRGRSRSEGVKAARVHVVLVSVVRSGASVSRRRRPSSCAARLMSRAVRRRRSAIWWRRRFPAWCPIASRS